MSTDLTTYENLLAAITVEDGQAVCDPATGEFIGNTKVSTTEDVDAAVATAREAQKSWGALPDAKRSEYLHQAADAVNQPKRSPISWPERLANRSMALTPGSKLVLAKHGCAPTLTLNSRTKSWSMMTPAKPSCHMSPSASLVPLVRGTGR